METTVTAARFTSLILECRQTVVEKKLIAMQKRAKKMGLPPISYVITPVDPPVYLYEDRDGNRYTCANTPSWMAKEFPTHEFTGYVLPRVEIIVVGQIPVFDGWRFVAKLTPTVDCQHNLIMTSPYYTNPDLNRYVDQVGVCEHCQQNRRRNATFVVEKTEEKFLRAVGRQCLTCFIGGTNPDKIIHAAEMLFSIAGTIEDALNSDFYKGSFYAVKSINTRELLVVGAAMIRKYGWISRAVAQDSMKMSTSDMCWKYFSDFRFPENESWKPTEEDRAVADETFAWMQSQQEPGEYYVNLRTMVGQEYTAHSACGLVVSAIQTMARKRADNATGAQIDEWFGAVDSRMETNVTLLRLHVVAGWHGTSCIHTFQTEDGHMLTWFASSNWFGECEVGHKFRIGFRVKGHDSFRGKKQTKISHVKMLLELSPVSA